MDLAADTIRSLVASDTIALCRSFKTRDTVECESPNSLAISFIVTLIGHPAGYCTRVLEHDTGE